MRSTPKFSLRKQNRKKGDQLLLSNAKDREASDFVSIEDRDETRNDEVDNSDPWLTMPYEIPIEVSQNKDIKGGNKSQNQNISNTKIVYISHDQTGITAKSIEAKVSRITKNKYEGSNNLQVGENAYTKLRREPSDGGAFDNILQQDSLEDIMAERNDKKTFSRSESIGKSARSFRIDAESSETSEPPLNRNARDNSIEFSSASSDSPPYPVDPRLTKKKGILIVDPQNNGEVYRMDEDNKCLTNKELIIIGGKRGDCIDDDDDDDDDDTLMSSLTEVTYQRSKEERMKFIMNNLKDAASQIPESRAWCNVFDCSSMKDLSASDNQVTPNYQGKNDKIDGNTVTRQGKLSMTQNAKILFNSLLNKSGERVNIGSFSEKIMVCITRIYLSLEEGDRDNGLRCTYNEPKLCHDVGVRLREATDGQAVVVEVIPESTAERSGVQIGDVLSFAVPLNNTFQGYEKACDFISRLELIGMRTSYRATFDMFLSKTSSGWPVATVFKRQSVAMKNFEQLPMKVISIDINIDLSYAASFFHEIVTRSRECDYYRESNGVFEAIRGNILSFMSTPQCRTSHKLKKAQRVDEIRERAKICGLDTNKGARHLFVPKIANDNVHHSMYVPDVRRSSLLTWYTENSDSVLYLKFNGTFGGSGVGVFRTNGGGPWSPPCAIRANILGVGFRPKSDCIECMIFIRDISDLEGLIKGDEITIGGKDQKERVLVVTNIADRFCTETNFLCSCVPRNDINTAFYSKYHSKPTTELIFHGKLPTPSEAASFGGALRRLELPSTMYPHPTPPNNLLKFNANDWTQHNSCKASGLLEPPYDESSITTLKEFLCTLENGEHICTDELNEFEVFTQKFNQMLFDGVTIDRAWPVENRRNDNDGSFTSKVTLKLDSSLSHSGIKQSLLFFEKPKTNRSGNECDFTKPTETSKNKFLSDSLFLVRIVEITQIMPKYFIKPHTSQQEIKKQRKKFVSIKTTDGKEVSFLARTGKDASLLACGIKLLVERSRERSHFQ